jgi:hypothetical protein
LIALLRAAAGADNNRAAGLVHQTGGDEKVSDFFITERANLSGKALGRDEKVGEFFSV